MTKVVVKIGFVPSYRGGYRSISPWCIKMRADSLAILAQVEGMEIVVPQPCPDDNNIVDATKEYVPDVAVCNLDQAEVVAEYFLREKVDGVIICALNFGDERSAAKIAEKLKVPVLLYATKEPPAREDASLERISDSYCGTLRKHG